MKRILFIAFFGLYWLPVAISEPKPIDYASHIEKRLKIDYFRSVDRLIHAVRIVESGLNDMAVGKSQDVGPLQITPIRLSDYNQKTGKNYSHADCFKFEVSKEIFLYYAGRIGIEKWEEICRKWNRSSQWQDEKGLQYWERVAKQLNKTI